MSASPVSAPPEPAVGRWLGRVRFAEALALQLEARDALAAGRGPPTVFALEHDPVLTLGRRGTDADIRWTSEQLTRAGVEVCKSPRGGQVTLHAPGQLVVYPVVHIGWKIRAHMTGLGEAAAALVRHLGVGGAQFRIEQPGVWVGSRKIASVGVHVSRGIAVQGVAINLDVDPTLFGSLVSCGMDGVHMTSVVAEGGAPVAVHVAAAYFVREWSVGYGARVRWPDPGVED